MTNAVKTEITTDGVLVVTIDRAERRNALDLEAWQGLQDGLAQTERADVGAVVLTGAGGTFCSGADLKTLPKGGGGIYSSTVRLGVAHEVLTRLHNCPKPTIAAVEGGAVGVGWSLALACDVTVASSGAFFLGPFLDRGFVPDGGVVWFLNRSIGRHRTADILMRGERVQAPRLAEIGLVREIVPDGEALAAANRFAAKLAAGPAETIEIFKRLLRRSGELSLGSYLEEERDAFALNHFTGHPAEGAASFVEKRPPRFQRPV